MVTMLAIYIVVLLKILPQRLFWTSEDYDYLLPDISLQFTLHLS
jgi:hypothetical protein